MNRRLHELSMELDCYLNELGIREDIRKPLSGPTDAQKKAGNYSKKHIVFQGLRISIENKKGSVRSGESKSGHKWSIRMKHEYGYIKGTKGADGDHVDVFMGPNKKSDKVFVVNQTKGGRGGAFDEHKVMLGFNSVSQARSAYLANYSKGWSSYRTIPETTIDDFKNWLKSGRCKQPFK